MTEEKKKWRVIQMQVDPQQEEMAGWLMMQLGANGCEVLDAGTLQATFEPDVLPDGDLTRLIAALDEYGLNSSVPSLRTNELVEEDWLSKWKEGFEPFTVGERLLVTPPWHLDKITPALRGDRAVVVIEPGLAFGTGFHETTRFCMLEMQKYVADAKRILDVGTGSGILAIAAALLNDHAEITAVETDSVACKNCGGNLQINKVEKRIRLVEGTTEVLLQSHTNAFDLILMNLTFEDHMALLPEYMKLAASPCTMIFAGILNEKCDTLVSEFAKHKLNVVQRTPGKTFTGLVATLG